LDYEFNDDSLRSRALTHRSAGSDHNERLEFLGDALLDLIIAEYLFERFPAADEGQLTRTRASLVNRETLAGIARDLELGNVLVLGEGEQKSGGWRRNSILANGLEAMIGAIYLDGGMEACRQVVETWFADKFTEIDPEHAAKDAKTELQELLQSRRFELPRYETTAVSGPSHDQTFTVACHTDALQEPVLAVGRSRRKAEQAAARAALSKLDS
jgi:ribonuclease III